MWDKVKNSLVFNVALLLVVIFVGYGSFKLVREALSLNQEVRSREEKIEELTRKKQELEVYLAELSTDEAVRREAKDRLNLKEPGEEVVVVAREEVKEEGRPPVNFWTRITNFLASVLNGL